MHQAFSVHVLRVASVGPWEIVSSKWKLQIRFSLKSNQNKTETLFGFSKEAFALIRNES